MNKVEHLIIEFRELMIIKRGLSNGDSKKQVRKRLKEIEHDLVDNHWDEISDDIKNRLGLRPKGWIKPV